jgi:hypothetical protein
MKTTLPPSVLAAAAAAAPRIPAELQPAAVSPSPAPPAPPAVVVAYDPPAAAVDVATPGTPPTWPAPPAPELAAAAAELPRFAPIATAHPITGEPLKPAAVGLQLNGRGLLIVAGLAAAAGIGAALLWRRPALVTALAELPAAAAA